MMKRRETGLIQTVQQIKIQNKSENTIDSLNYAKNRIKNSNRISDSKNLIKGSKQ